MTSIHPSPRLLLMTIILVCACSAALFLGSCGQREIPLIEQHCGTCHSAAVVYQTRRSEEGWRQVMHGMKIRGMKITPLEEEQVYSILFEKFLLQQ